MVKKVFDGIIYLYCWKHFIVALVYFFCEKTFDLFINCQGSTKNTRSKSYIKSMHHLATTRSTGASRRGAVIITPPLQKRGSSMVTCPSRRGPMCGLVNV